MSHLFLIQKAVELTRQAQVLALEIYPVRLANLESCLLLLGEQVEVG